MADKMGKDGDVDIKLSGFQKREKRRAIRKLQDAITEGNTDIVKEVLATDIDVDFQYRGQTALQQAVREGKFEMCRLLIDRGADVNKTDAEVNSLLNNACWRGHTDIAQLLLSHNVDVDRKNDNGASPLNACAVKGRDDIIPMLIETGCDLDSLNTRGQTSLYSAVQQDNIESLKILLAAGCDIDKGDYSQRSPLILAACEDRLEALKLLLSSGCNIDKQDKLGQTALYHASSLGHFDVVAALIQAGVDVNIPTIKGFCPLLDSIRKNHINIAKALVRAGCDINQRDRLKHAPIHEAIRQVSQYFGDTDKETVNIVQLLVSAGADLCIRDNEHWTPLYQAAYSGDLEITKLLLNNGAPLQVSTSEGQTILHGGVYGNNPDIVDLFIQSGCHMNQVNSEGQHPLMAAVSSRVDIRIVRSLIDAGSDLNLADLKEQRSPLHKAIQHHHNEGAILLIDSGCDINCVNSYQQTPLFNACEKGKVDVVTHLLRQARLHKHVSVVSALPLHAAAVNGHVQIVQLLVEAEYDINQMNDGGLTPLQAAIQENKFSVCKTLLQLGCDVDAHAKTTRLMKCCFLQEDAHPHFALEPLFLAMSNKDLDLMRLLIQCYVHVPYRIIKTLGVILKQSQELRFLYSPQNKTDIFQIFTNALKKSRTLQDISRCQVRSLLGSRPQVKVMTLPVANKIRNYILMTDMFLSLEEQERLEEELVDQNGFVTA